MSGILIIVLFDFYYKFLYYIYLFYLIKDVCIQNKNKIYIFVELVLNFVSIYKCINIIVFVKFYMV